MTTSRKIALALAGTLAVCVVLLVSVPFLFRGAIETRVRSAVEARVNAGVEWSGVGLSLLRDFPSASLRLDDLAVTGRDRFQGDTLARVPRLDLSLELPSVLRAMRGAGPLVVRSVKVTRPAVHLLVLEDGAANWEIFPESAAAEDTTSRSLELSLRGLEIEDAALAMENRKSDLAVSVDGLDESLRGDFRKESFTLASSTSADSVSVRFAGVPYLSRARLSVDTDLDVDSRAGRVTVRKGDVRVNELPLAVTGSFTSGEDSSLVDLAFRAPGTSFKEILSLVPAVYLRDGFDRLQASGTMAVAGRVKGGFGEHAFPALSVNATVTDAAFRYPDLPMAAREISFDARLTNPGGDVDRTVLTVQRAHLRIGENPIDGSLELRTPVSDPAVAMRLAGRLDLADLGRTVRLPEGTDLAGRVDVDASVNARASDLDAQRYDRVGAEGTVALAGLRLASADLPHPVEVEEGRLRLSPRYAEIVSLRGRAGKSDASITGRLDNLLGFAMRDEELRGSARVESRFVDLNEWRSDDSTQAVPVPRNLDLSLEAAVARLAYADFDVRDLRGALRVKDGRASLQDLRMQTLGGTLAISGSYETTTPARPTFDLEVHADSVDAAQAFSHVATVRALAPVARYAQGRLSSELRMTGALGQDLTPVFQALSGRGSFETAGLGLRDVPALERLSDALKLAVLKDPTLQRTRSSFTIRDGRLQVSPFDVHLGPVRATVGGSHGFDGSLDYALVLAVPRRLLGAGADQVVTSLARRAGKAGLDWQAADTVALGAKIGGTVQAPAVSTDFRGTARSALQGVASAARQNVEQRATALTSRADSAAEVKRRELEAEAARRLAAAQAQAARIRQEAHRLADETRKVGYARADSLVARTQNPLARRVATAGADRLRKETDAKVNGILQEADRRADALVQAAGAPPAPAAQ